MPRPEASCLKGIRHPGDAERFPAEQARRARRKNRTHASSAGTVPCSIFHCSASRDRESRAHRRPDTGVQISGGWTEGRIAQDRFASSREAACAADWRRFAPARGPQSQLARQHANAGRHLDSGKYVGNGLQRLQVTDIDQAFDADIQRYLCERCWVAQHQIIRGDTPGIGRRIDAEPFPERSRIVFRDIQCRERRMCSGTQASANIEPTTITFHAAGSGERLVRILIVHDSRPALEFARFPGRAAYGVQQFRGVSSPAGFQSVEQRLAELLQVAASFAPLGERSGIDLLKDFEPRKARLSRPRCPAPRRRGLSASALHRLPCGSSRVPTPAWQCRSH